MTCTHCGKEIDNDLAFCPYCGSRTENGAAAAEKPAKKNPRRFALPVAAAALLAVVGVGLANRKPSIDLQRYVTITAHGYDTLGTLDVAFDASLDDLYSAAVTRNIEKYNHQDNVNA